MAICRRFKSRPLISIGTARLLAAADLASRISTDDFYILGSGDLASEPPDLSYTGADYFWVAFVSGEKIYVYSVDAYGRVTLFGELKNHDPHEPGDSSFDE